MRTIQFGSIYHMPWLEYRHALPDGRVALRWWLKSDHEHPKKPATRSV